MITQELKQSPVLTLRPAGLTPDTPFLSAPLRHPLGLETHHGLNAWTHTQTHMLEHKLDCINALLASFTDTAAVTFYEIFDPYWPTEQFSTGFKQ